MTPIDAPKIVLAAGAGWIAAGVIAVLLVSAALFLLFGPGPRRARGYHRAKQSLAGGNWEEALQVVRGLGGNHPQVWQDRFRKLEGDCLQAGGQAALREGRYEEAHQQFQASAGLLGLDPSALRQHVVDAMLGQVRALVSTGADVRLLLDRILALQPASAEVFFWRALLLAREGPVDQAMTALDRAHQLGNKQNIDPPLYMGVLLHRQGKPQDALRVLAEANRVDAGCPFVAWQMGLSMVAAGGDSGMAVRILQKALGPKGLPLWGQVPNRAWIEAFPQGRSFVRRLAEKYVYSCPVLGADLRNLIRQGEMALGQAYYRMGSFQESADTYNKLLQESAPTLPVLRGLGLALTRLGKYDQAFKHLRAAMDMEPQHGLTAGYLALCGAKGRPAQPEDRPKNVAWALRQVSRFDGTGNGEYAAIMSSIHAEARELNLEIPREDQVKLCQVLASVHAHDAEAAGGYLLLSRQHPSDVRDEYAWLFGRSAVAHGRTGEGELDLLARVFRDRESTQNWYRQQSWDLEEVEHVYLERYAARHPGSFPEILGPDYPPRGEALLEQRSTWLEEMNDLEGAQKSVAVWLLLAPRSVAAHDRAACLHYRRDQPDRSLRILEAWQELTPADPLPLARRAVIEQQQGALPSCLGSVEKALSLAQRPARATIAFLGAKLMLTAWNSSQNGAMDGLLQQAERFLMLCLRDHADHTAALWMMAALRALRGDEPGLVALEPAMNRPDVEDARFQLMAAICALVAGKADQAVEVGKKAMTATELADEGRYVVAWAQLQRGEDAAALQLLQQVAASTGPSAEHARGLLGQLNFRRGVYSESIKWWTGLNTEKRAAWQLDEALRQTVLLAGLIAFKTGQYEQAADRFKEASRLGLRDRRLGPLIGLSLVKGAQRLLYQGEG
jgi:tetratricopeptide (TPR) repeat protein